MRPCFTIRRNRVSPHGRADESEDLVEKILNSSLHIVMLIVILTETQFIRHRTEGAREMILVTRATGIAARRWFGRCWSSVGRAPLRARSGQGAPGSSATPPISQPATSRTRGRFARRLPELTCVFLSGADDPRRSNGRRLRLTLPPARGCAGSSSSPRSWRGAGIAVAFWDWHGRIEQHLCQLGGLLRRPALRASSCRTCWPLQSRWRSAGLLYAPAGGPGSR